MEVLQEGFVTKNTIIDRQKYIKTIVLMQKFIYNRKYKVQLGETLMSCLLYLIRHGETDWNRERRVQGSIDIPLNENGMMQATKLSYRFRSLTLHAIYSSDLTRAYHTAQAIASFHPSIRVTALKELHERSYGLLEGKFLNEVTLTHSNERNDWMELEQYGIEPLKEVKNRMFRCIDELVRLHDGQSIAIVSHGGAIGAFLSVISNGETGSGKIKLGNTSVCEIDFSGEYQIKYVNDTSHLSVDQNLVIG